MKNSALALFVALALWTNCINAQTRAPQDVRRVTVTSKYDIVDGKKTNQYKTIQQDIYDSLGHKHTVVHFNPTTGKIDGYTWNTFQDGRLVSVEEFCNDKLLKKIEYTYTSNSLVDKEKISTTMGQELAINLILKYTYNAAQKPVKVVATSGKGKKAYTLKAEYNSNGVEVKRKVSVKKGFMPQDSILELTNLPKYDSIGRVVSEQIYIKCANGRLVNTVNSYSYDKQGNISQKTESDKSGNLLYTYSYKCNSKGRVIVVDKKDASGKLVESFAYRHEVYPKSNISQREVEY